MFRPPPSYDAAEKLHAQLTPAPPIEIDYVVRTYGRKNPTIPDCYDILVDLPTPATAGHHQFIERLNRDRDVEACDARIAAAAKKIGGAHSLFTPQHVFAAQLKARPRW